jgi:hypothetical protein
MTVINSIKAHFNIYVQCLHDVRAVFVSLTCGLHVRRSVARSRIVVVAALWEGERVTHCS